MRTGISFTPLTLVSVSISARRQISAAHRTTAPACPRPTLTAAHLAELAAAPFTSLPPSQTSGLVGASHTSTARFIAGIAAAIGVLTAFFIAVHF